MKKLTTDKFIELSKLAHGDKYNYSKVEYTHNKSKVKIICPIHGEFEQEPRHHAAGRGCTSCGRLITETARKSTTNEFIDKAKKIHSDKYYYSNVNYITDRIKIDIICPIHGSFKQTPNGHLQGNGCPNCKNEKMGWNYQLWEQQAETSNSFDSFKLYMIKCWDDTETFYKIGKTFNKLNTRFSGNLKLPYNWEVIKFIEGSAKQISELETELKRNHKEHSYTPKKVFGGMYECYSSLIY
jgi:hypothetical protein